MPNLRALAVIRVLVAALNALVWFGLLGLFVWLLLLFFGS
jgi:hypothetical protein